MSEDSWLEAAYEDKQHEAETLNREDAFDRYGDPDREDEANAEDCTLHGPQPIVEEGHTPGFTGAPVWWWRLECGCTQHDDSADSLAAAE